VVFRHTLALQERQQYLSTMTLLSNQWQDVSHKLDDQKQLNGSLERNLAAALEDASRYSNKASQFHADTSKTIFASQVSPASHSVSQPDPKIVALESERDGLNVKIEGLNDALAKLDCEMAETKRKLQSSEGDRTALLEQLKRLQTERDKLLGQFYDLAQVREQLHRLKAEQATNRRLDWIRRGLYGNSKGSELLQKNLASAASSSRNYDLNVDLHHNESAPSSPPTP
jgi:chromosome segregation ATPase